MPSSTRSRSQRGTNGPVETQEDLNRNESNQTPLPLNPSLESPLPSEDVEVAVVPTEREGFKSGRVFMSEQDVKLARKMSKAISESLGLNSRSRSYRV
jgi:hypothetical protein